MNGSVGIALKLIRLLSFHRLSLVMNGLSAIVTVIAELSAPYEK
jgi:hypothetical protein